MIFCLVHDILMLVSSARTTPYSRLEGTFLPCLSEFATHQVFPPTKALDFSKAQVLLNLDRFQPAKVDFNVYDVCWSSPSSKSCDFFEDASVRDLWSKEELGVRKSIQAGIFHVQHSWLKWAFILGFLQWHGQGI